MIMSTVLIYTALTGIIGKMKWKLHVFEKRAAFWLWNVQRSYLFNDIIAFWSLIQLYHD